MSVFSNLTQEEAYNVVKEMEDRALELIQSAKKIAKAYDIPATLLTVTQEKNEYLPVKVIDGKLVVAADHGWMVGV